MSYRRKRFEQEEQRRKRTKRLSIAVVLVFLFGIGAGIGLNIVFGKNPVIHEKRKTNKQEVKKEKEKPSISIPQEKETVFSVSQAMGHIYVLSEQIGSRPAGSIRESQTGDYIVQKLGEYGYTVEEQPFTMADGLGSRNIIASKPGRREGYTIILGAHYDSPQSKGAIDNATGVGALLELARVFSEKKLDFTLKFVFFGGNKPGGSPAERFQGSRYFVEALGTLEKKDIIGVIVVDSVGAGDSLALRTQEKGLMRLKAKLETFAGENGIKVISLKATDDSDNIPFEDSQIPSVWIECCNSSGSISVPDTYENVLAARVQAAGELILKFLEGLNDKDLDELKY